MAWFDVVFFYHASASYEVEADDADEALAVARRERQNQSPEEFFEQLNLDETDFDVEEVEYGDETRHN